MQSFWCILCTALCSVKLQSDVIQCLLDAIFFPRVILYTSFSFLAIYGGGVLGLGSCVGFLGWGFQMTGFGAGALYINIEEKPWVKG